MRFLAGLPCLLLVVSLAHAADDIAAARDHYQRASRLYDLGHYPEAAKEFELAYEAKDDPAFLYNIAQAYRLSGENEKAVRAYQSFLRRSPEAPNRREVEGRIQELSALVEQQRKSQHSTPTGVASPALPDGNAAAPPKPVESPAPTVAPAPPPPREAEAPSPGRAKIIAGAVVAGVGLAAVGVGIAFGVSAMQASDQITNAPPGTVFDPSIESSGQTAQAVSIALLSVGAVATVAGAVVLGLGVRERRAPQVAFAPALSPGGFGAAVVGRF